MIGFCKTNPWQSASVLCYGSEVIKYKSRGKCMKSDTLIKFHNICNTISKIIQGKKYTKH